MPLGSCHLTVILQLYISTLFQHSSGEDELTGNVDTSDLVSMLWSLKREFGRHPDAGLPFIHLNSLIKDEQYRQDVLIRAADSGIPELEKMAEQIFGMQTGSFDAPLTPPPLTPEPPREPPKARPAQAPLPRRRKKSLPLAAKVGIGVAALGAVAAGVYSQVPNNDIKSLISNEVHVSGSLLENQVWTANKTYILDDIVYVESGVRLTIEPGTQVKGTAGSALVVTRDARIYARGNPKAPIIFSSANPEGQRARGDWGGVVMLGNAPINREQSQIEGLDDRDTRGTFGGSDTDANCGLLEYVRIEFAGHELSANNELNALTLGGCGSGTVIRHVQVHRAQDDGVEVFGGNVDLKHILISGAKDDAFDWDMGWQGRVQFLVVQQHADVGDNAFEGDSNKKEPDIEPRSKPKFYNVTLASPSSNLRSQRAMTIRRGSGGEFKNMLISGFSSEAIDIRDVETARLISSGELQFEGIAMSRIGLLGSPWFQPENGEDDDDGGFNEEQWFRSKSDSIMLSSSSILAIKATSETDPDFSTFAIDNLHSMAVLPPQEEFWDESATYLGAIRPGARVSWLSGWTQFPRD